MMEKVNEFKNGLVSQEGYQPALKRVEQLLDAESFSETGAFFNASGVITGSGTVDGRLVYVYSQYGPVNAVHAAKLADLYEAALSMGVPVVGLLDSSGMEIEGGLKSLDAYGKIYGVMADASGVIPQISMVLGACAGSASVIAGLSDFVFMAAEGAALYLQSPNTYDDAAGNTFHKHSSAKYHYEQGTIDFMADNEGACIANVKALLNFLPSNNLDDSPVTLTDDDINREENKLNNCAAGNDPVDMAMVIRSLSDNGNFLEVGPGAGKSIVTGFIRLNGYTAGVIANKGLLCKGSVKKAVSFIAFCDAFNIALISLTDAKGFAADSSSDAGLIQAAASLVYAYANATVPKINVIVRNAVGNSYLLMGAKHSGADLVYAWPDAAISVLEKQAAKKVLGADIDDNPVEAGKAGLIDDIIEPAKTRKKLIMAIETLASKRVFKHSKKHGSIVF